MASILVTQTLMSEKSVAASATVYTDSVAFDRCVGDACVLVISTAGTLAITQQCSLDNVDFYSPVNATPGAVGSVAPSQTVTTGTYISYTPIQAEYIRYKIVESTAATTVTVKLSYRKEV